MNEDVMGIDQQGQPTLKKRPVCDVGECKEFAFGLVGDRFVCGKHMFEYWKIAQEEDKKEKNRIFGMIEK